MLRDGYSEDDGVMPTEKSRALMLDHFWLGGPGVQQNNFRCYRCRSIHRGAGIGGRPTPQVLTYVNGGWTSTRFSGVDFPRGQITLRYRLLAEASLAKAPSLRWRPCRDCSGATKIDCLLTELPIFSSPSSACR